MMAAALKVGTPKWNGVVTPNQGASATRLKSAKPKIAPYPFTTLEPQLGIVVLDDERQFVAAEVPGLVEGASRGRGLGFKFLRHIERCRVLAVVVDATVESPSEEVSVLERELEAYSPAVAEKPRVMVLSKADLIAPEDRPGTAARVGAPEARLVSAQSGEGIRDLLEELWKRLHAEPAVKDSSHGG